MAEPRRFHFDSETRSVGVPASRRRVRWYWIAISLAIHGAVVLFVLAGAARGGHTELAGTLEVTLVGPPIAGDPAGKSNETAEAKPEPSEPAARPDEKPAPAKPEPLPRPASAQPAEAAPPMPPREAAVPPPPVVQPPAPKTDALPPPPTPAALPTQPQPPAPPPSPDGMARPVPPTAPADSRPSKVETAPARPNVPDAAASVIPPARPKSAPAATATPAAKATEKAAAPKQGIEKAVEGQTASLGSPTGSDRLGRSENDDASGVLNVNVNPRFRQPPAPPHYPRGSVERDEEGVVLVRAFVDPAGTTQRVVVFRSSGFPLLDEAALKAVRGWRFEPMVRDGRATAAWVQVPVRFRLN